MRAAAAALAVVAAVVAALAAPARGENILTLDCQGGLHVLEGLPLETHVNLASLKAAANLLGEQWLERARCACGEAPDAELIRRFVPSADFFVAALAHQDDGNGGYTLDDSAFENSCAGTDSGVQAVFSAISSAFPVIDGAKLSGVELPSTCSYQSLQNGQGCQLTLNGMVNSTWVKSESTVLNVVIDRCEDSITWPFISIDCEGTDCDQVLVQPCDSDADCTSEFQSCKGFFGNTTEDAIALMADLGFTVGDDATCATAGREIQLPVFADEILLGIFGLEAEPGLLFDMRTCTPTFYDLASIARDLIVDGGSDSSSSSNSYGGYDGYDGGDGSSSSSSESTLDALLGLISPPFSATEVKTEITDTAMVLPGFDIGYCASLGCHPSHLGDGYCNPKCNVPECLYDGNECANCECVSGSDYSTCNKTSYDGFFIASFSTYSSSSSYLDVFPAAQPSADVCAVDTNSTLSEYDAFAACGEKPPATSGPEWFCTINGEQTAEGGIVNGTVLFSATSIDSNGNVLFDCADGDESVARQRLCTCASPVNVSECWDYPFDYAITWTIAGEFPEDEALCGPRPTFETCPLATLTTAVPRAGLVSPLALDPATFDKDGNSHFTPDIAPADSNILYTLCDGTIVANLFNPFLSVAVAMPNLNSTLTHLKNAIRQMDDCGSNWSALAGDNATVAFDFWKPAFWLGALMPGDYISSRGNATLGYKFENSEPLTFSNAESLNVENLLSGPSSPVRFEISLAEPFGVSQFDVAVEIDTCDSENGASELSQLKVALVAPFIQGVVDGVSTCADTLLDTCPGTAEDSFCFDFSTPIASIFGDSDDGSETTGLGEFSYIFDAFVWRDTIAPPELCLELDDRFSLLSVRRLLFDLVLADGVSAPLEVPALTEELLLACLPVFFQTIDSLFSDSQVYCYSNSPYDTTCNDGLSVTECEESFANLTLPQCSSYGSTYDPYTSATNCSTAIGKHISCDYAVCVGYQTANTIVYGGDYHAQYSYVDGAGLQYVSALESCMAECGYSLGVHPYDSTLPLDYECFQATNVCTEPSVGTYTCPEDTGFDELRQSYTLTVEVNLTASACPAHLPYAYIDINDTLNKCCSNDGGRSSEERSVSPMSCDISSDSCPTCGDYVPSYSESTDAGYCEWDVLEYPCTGTDIYIFVNGSETYVPYYPTTSEGCDAICASFVAANSTCTCNTGEEDFCFEVSANVTCTQDSVAGQGTLWSEAHRTAAGTVVQLDPDTDTYGSVTVYDFDAVMSRTEEVPGSLYTAIAPVPLSANFSEDGTGIEITFDAPSNQVLGSVVSGVVECAEILVISSEAASDSVCYWTSSTVLFVSLSAQSTVSLNDELSFLAGNGIRAATGYSPEVSGTLIVSWGASAYPTPQISLRGVSEVSPCGETLSLTGLATSGAAGRALTWTLQIDDTTSEATVFSASGLTSPLFEYSFTDAGIVAGESYEASAQATNWLGEISTIAYWSFSVATEDIPTITIESASPLVATRGVTRVTVDATTQFTCGLPTTTYEYAWTYSSDNWITSNTLNGYTSSAYRKFAVDRFPVGSFKLRVTTRVKDSPSVEAHDEIDLVINAPELALVPTGGFYRAIFRNEILNVDFSRSCNPAAAVGCDPVFGATAGSAAALTPFLSTPVVVWSCSRSDNVACGLSLPASTSLVWTMPSNTLVAGIQYFFTATVNGQASKVVTIEVRPTIACAVIPSVSIAPVDPVLTVPNAGVVLKGSVSNYVPGASTNTVKLIWQRMVTDDAGTLVAQSATSFASVVSRPQLVLSKASLTPGTTYTFRLTARQECSESSNNHPFAQVTFTVNKPPSNGYVSSALTTGFAYDTDFTFVATGFSDDNTPLTYSFEYTFQKPTGILRPEDTYSLGPFSASPTLRTSLELPAAAAGVNGSATMYITVVARDALGAESQRVNFLAITLQNPIKSPLWAPPDFANELQNVTAEGGKDEDLLRAAISLGSLVNSAAGSNVENLEAWATSTRNAALGYLQGVNVTEREDPFMVSLQINLLLTLVSGEASTIDTDFQDQSISLLRDFIDQANQTIIANRRAEDDPAAVGILPSSVQDNTLESLTRILAAARETVESSARRLSGRARMLSDEASCGIVSLTRSTIEELARLSLQNYAEGAAARQFQSSGIQLATARESTSALGTGSEGGDGLSSVALPGSKTGKSASSNTTSSSSSSSRGSFVLPADIVSGMDFGDADAPSEIDLIAVSYSMNIRCEVVFNVTLIDADGNSEDECNLTSEIVQYTGPVSEVTDVVSLDFVDTSDPERRFDPSGLDEGITIQVPRNDVLDADLCEDVENATELVCGFFDPDTNEWSTSGCELSGNQTDPDSFVTCVCNHASDYAVWHAFTDDVRQTFSDPITSVTSIALLLLGVLFPSIFFVWIVGLWWANRRDKTDANSIQKGAIGMMYLRRMQARSQQRRFFENLKAMVRDQQNVSDLDSYKDLQANPHRPRPLFNRSICKNFFLAIVYEHSLLGLIKYDAHYSRMQRVSVFVAICMGNALAASIFFELKTAEDVSTGFLFGTIIMCSLFVSIPIRVFVKALFRISDLQEGSRGSRVSTAFEALSHIEERPMDESEVALLLCYNRVFRAKAQVASLRAQIRLAKRQTPAITSQAAVEAAALVPGSPGGGETDSEQAIEVRSLEELQTSLEDALNEHREAKLALLQRTRNANAEWRTLRTEDAIARINRVRKQKSAIMRVTALLSDEAQVVGKPRRPMLGAAFKYVAWFIMFCFYAFSAFYVTRFVLTRADRVGSGAAENEILLIWLGTAASGIIIGYVVAEPTIFFLRYALFPYILIRFGHNSDTVSDQADGTDVEPGDAHDDDDSNQGSTLDRRKSRLSEYFYDHSGKRGARKEKKKGSDNTVLLELAADMLEAGL
ncbi:Sperm receptor for egg jelly [Hondaea fermentalgiana]|uniref:Sperm receptor for egg jelly n=1 Tax=Hondaea fermentalgiana TaxID=2315210 RepID=A0A2R5GQH3_9STRA|nr:Sperm receptor for egg jelly [Hondaea fermentalgiana]|eukprot:GBG33122.1 Sperm receptor for egg jelly [Hondaea fermentalgiana]